MIGIQPGQPRRNREYYTVFFKKLSNFFRHFFQNVNISGFPQPGGSREIRRIKKIPKKAKQNGGSGPIYLERSCSGPPDGPGDA
jgi:hypothetical protein